MKISFDTNRGYILDKPVLIPIIKNNSHCILYILQGALMVVYLLFFF